MKRSGVKDEEARGFRIPRKERNHVAGNPLNTFTQDFNTNFLQTSNSGTVISEFVNVSRILVDTHSQFVETVRRSFSQSKWPFLDAVQF